MHMKSIPSGTAAANTGARARERRLDAYILSGDDAFLLEIGNILGDRFRTRPIDHADELPQDLSIPWLAFIDGSRADARSLLQKIERRLPNAALIVITIESEQGLWQGPLRRGSICGLVDRNQMGDEPMEQAIARAQLRLSSNHQLQPTASAAITPIVTKWGRRLSPWMLVAAALIALAGVGWYLARGSKSNEAAKPVAAVTPVAADVTAPTAAATAPPPALAPAAPQRSTAELLSLARTSFRDPDRQLPRTDGPRRGDSSLELYDQALRQEPGNEEALDGLRRLFTVARARMQTDLNAGRIDDAQRTLAVFKVAGMDSNATRQLESDIAAAMPKWLAAQARRELSANDVATAEQNIDQLAALGGDRVAVQDLRRALETRKADTQMLSMAEGVRAAIAGGNLADATPNSARSKLLLMRQQSRTNSATVAVTRELQEALLQRAREARSAGQLDVAQRLVTSALEWGTNGDATELRRQIQADTDQVAARTSAAAAASSAASTPIASTPNAPSFVTAKPTRALNVTYPERAASQSQTGYVVVEFTLQDNGRASDVAVIESSPKSVFDRSAIDAVGRGRFDTAVLGESKQPRRARIRITFKPS
jgi:TonB family protein